MIELSLATRITLDANNGVLPSHTKLGGYPVYYIDRQNNCICSVCANKEIETFRELGSDYIDIGELPESFEINHENSLTCDACSKLIESAYE